MDRINHFVPANTKVIDNAVKYKDVETDITTSTVKASSEEDYHIQLDRSRFKKFTLKVKAETELKMTRTGKRYGKE